MTSVASGLPASARESRFDGDVVFVVGCPRSGTTWLTRMLVAHPAVTAFPGEESQLFSSLSGLSRLRPPTAAGDTGPAVVAAVRRYCDRLLLAARDAARPGASFVVDKTPAHVHQLPFIGNVYPDAWFVHILRDGRDVARSLLEFEHGPDSITECAAMWRRAVEDAWEHGPRLARYREVRYEALVEDPVDAVAELLGWIGAPVDDAIRDALGAAAGVRVSQYNTSGPVGVGKWRTMDRRDLAEIERVAGDTLRRAGYA